MNLEELKDKIEEGKLPKNWANDLTKAIIWGAEPKYPERFISDKEAETSDTLSEVIGQ
jgi:hypothetical protein